MKRETFLAIGLGGGLLLAGVAVSRPSGSKLRDDGVFETPISVPAEGGGCPGVWSRIVLGSGKQEALQYYARFYSECNDYPTEQIGLLAHDGWLCLRHQGAPDAACIAFPGAAYDDGTAAPTGRSWREGDLGARPP